MRMRRLKWAHDFIQNCTYCEKNPELNKGLWKSHLDTKELHIEIGSGKGDYWLSMSELYPGIGWIGIEKQESVAALALRKAEHAKENRAFIYDDADKIDTFFDKGEVDAIHLNFSDPWPKNRTKKRRLTHNRFLEKYYDILADNGLIIMKSDNKDLFAYTLIEMNLNKFQLIDCDLDFRRADHLEDAFTEYEKKFSEKGQPIYRAVWRKI